MVSILFWTAVVVLVAFAVLYMLNKRAASRTVEFGSAQAGKFGNWLWGAGPKGMAQKIIDDATDEISTATTAIEEHRGMLNSTNREADDYRREVAQLDAKVKNSLADDPDDKNGRAAEYVSQLANAKSTLVRKEAQLQKLKDGYQNNVKKIQLSRQRIKDAKDRVRQNGINLDMAKTEAAIAKLNLNFNVNSANLDGLAEVEEEMKRQIDRYEAVGQVQTDLGMDGLKEMEEEERLRKAEAKNLLEEYKKNMTASK